MRPRVLFVCIENSNRSQMAEAFARMHGGERVEVFSSGSRPSGKVNARAIEFMKEVGYDLTTHGSKSLDDILGYHYYTELAHSAGMSQALLAKDADPRERVREIVKFMDRYDNTAQYGWFVDIARTFLGFDEKETRSCYFEMAILALDLEEAGLGRSI